MKALTMMLVFATAVMSTPSFAATKCVPTTGGGMCCWDTEKEGPFKPLNC
jgi:hypothetical protein